MTKERVDIGIPNNPSTGDVLADGGVKINNNFDEIYNSFSDMRLFTVDYGIGKQKIHATGYWQKHNPTYYSRVIDLGSNHDIDTTTGSITIKLPKLKVGECINIINSNNSITNDKNIKIQCESTDSFVDGDTIKTFRTAGIDIKLWGTSESRGSGRWDYSADSLFSKTEQPVWEDTTVQTTGTVIDIANINDYKVIKMMLFFYDDIQKLSKSSEVILHINSATKSVYHTEYGIVNVGSEEDMFDMTFTVNSSDLIQLTIKTKIGNNARFIIKSIDTI